MKACVPLLALPTLALGAATEWPQFRGPDGQGVSEAREVPREWSTDAGIAWKVPVPEGWASPVLSGGLLALAYAREVEGRTALGVMLLDSEDGSEVWRRDLFTPGEDKLDQRHAKNGLASPTPLIADDRIYAHFGHMGTAALDLIDGRVRWKQVLDYPPLHGNGSSPVLVDGKLILPADARTDPELVALDADSGEIAWRAPRDNAEVRRKFSFATPLVICHGGRAQVISPASGMVAAYDPADGAQLWKARYGEGFSVVPRPVFAEGRLFIATGFMKPELMAVEVEGAEGDVTDSHVVWREDKWMPKTPSILEDRGTLYILDDTGTLSARQAATGSLLWREKLPGNFSASPVLAEGAIFACSEDGQVFVVEVSPERAEVLREIEMGERMLASPAVVDGAIYLRTAGHLWKVTGS